MYSRNLVITIIFLLIFTLLNLIVSLYLTDFHFTYALDDAYIHMSIVRHLVEDGMWSLDGYSYASASSSPLWTLFLSPFYMIFGAKLFVYIPFILNIVFQILSLWLIFKIIKEYSGKELHYIYGIFIVIATPFIALSFGGMEHSLQIYLVLLFINTFLNYMSEPNSKKFQLYLILLSPFVVFVRYEDFALTTLIALVILFYFKNWKVALSIIFSSILFVVIFGLISKYVWHLSFLPTPIIAKSVVGDANLLLGLKYILANFVGNVNPYITLLYICNILILLHSYISNRKNFFILSLLFILTLFAHLSFDRVGQLWLYRYEAYLMIFGVLNILLYLYSIFPNYIKYSNILLLLLIPIILKRVVYSEYYSILATKNIYEQQIQMATFLKKECNRCSIGANDIGAITYYTDIKLLDLFGLGSYEVLKYKKSHNYNSETVGKLLKRYDVSLIIIYDKWFKKMKLKDYKKIAEWRISHNVICGDDKVSFYSRDDKIEENIQKLKKFSEFNLPNGVIYKLSD